MPAARKYAPVRRDPDVAGQRQAQSAADRGAVDRGDDRLVHLAQRQDDVVEHLHRPQRERRPGQPVDVRHRAGRLVVGTGRESAAGAGEHDHTHALS